MNALRLEVSVRGTHGELMIRVDGGLVHKEFSEDGQLVLIGLDHQGRSVRVAFPAVAIEEVGPAYVPPEEIRARLYQATDRVVGQRQL